MTFPVDLNTFQGLALFSSSVKDGKGTYRIGPLERVILSLIQERKQIHVPKRLVVLVF
jgi:hypothetical protein